MGTLVFWCDAFEMAISTVGVGFGCLLRISDRNEFKFHQLVRISWIVSIFAMIFCFLSALVVFTEIALLGLVTNAKEYTHIIAGGWLQIDAN